MWIKNNSLIWIIFFAFILSTSCVPFKKIKYFNDIDALETPALNPKEQKVITPFDKLYIHVMSTDEQTAKILNFANQGDGGSGVSSAASSYLVDENGKIDYPYIGKISLGGLTLAQASSVIQLSISSLISNSFVIVKFIDNQVTVMGEVKNEGIHTITQDKINIYEAIALGGGITDYGDRKNVILMRMENNKPIHYKLDLSTSRISSTQMFYVMPNDVIIVEPLRSKSLSFQNSIYSNILATITALVAILYVTNSGIGR